jgi:subtilisin-like proprotein convertase family protein
MDEDLTCFLFCRDEDPVGEWTLHVIDWKNPQFTGSFTNWTLTLWGEMEEEVDGEIIHIATPVDAIPPAPSHTLQEPSSQITPLPSISSNDKPATDVAAQSTGGLSMTPSTTTSTIYPSTSLVNDDTYEANDAEDVSKQQERPDYTNYTDDTSRTRKDSSTLVYYFYVVLLGMVVAGLSWMIRRRIKGPGSAKDITAYTNLSQQPYRRNDSFVYEFDMLNQGRRLQRLSEEDDDDDNDNKDDKQGDIPVVDVSRSTTDCSPLKRQPSSSPPDYGKGK